MRWICLILRKVYVILLLLGIGCTYAPNKIHTPEPPVTYNLEEKLGTQHEYRKNPLFKDATQISLYCLIHKYPEVITVVRLTDGKLEYSGVDDRFNS